MFIYKHEKGGARTTVWHNKTQLGDSRPMLWRTSGWGRGVHIHIKNELWHLAGFNQFNFSLIPFCLSFLWFLLFFCFFPCPPDRLQVFYGTRWTSRASSWTTRKTNSSTWTTIKMDVHEIAPVKRQLIMKLWAIRWSCTRRRHLHFSESVCTARQQRGRKHDVEILSKLNPW